MAKKNHTIVKVVERPKSEKSVEEILEDLGDEQNPEEIEANEKLAEFQASYGGKEYRIRVERFNKEDAEWEIIPQGFKLDGFDPILQLRPYGPGKYRMTLLDSGGKYVKGGRQEIRIAAALEPTGVEKQEQKSALEDPMIKILLENMRHDKEAMTELLKTFVARPQEAPKGPGVMELIDSLAKLKTLSPDQGSGLKDVKGMIELMAAVKSLQPESDAGSGEGLMSDILQAVKVMKETGLMNRGAAPHQPTLPIANPPAPQIPMEVKQPMPETVKVENPIIEGVRKYIPIFVSRAKRNEDVELTADFLIDELNGEIVPLICANYRPGGLTLKPIHVVQNLIDRAQDAAEVSKIFDFAPELAPYKEWVHSVVAAAVKELTEPETTNEAESEDDTKAE